MKSSKNPQYSGSPEKATAPAARESNVSSSTYVSEPRRSIIAQSKLIPKDYQFNVLLRKRSLYNRLCFFLPQPQPFTAEELEQNIHKLHKFCLTHLQDSYRVHLNRMKGVEILEQIIARGNFDDLKPLQAMSLIWCTLSCVHHFFIRLSVTHGPMEWARRMLLHPRRQAKKAIRIYEMLIALTSRNLFGSIVYAILTFYTESRMWHTESLSAELLKRLFYISGESEATVHAILDVAEKNSVTNVREARQVIRVLYQVLEDFPWDSIDEGLLYRLLTMFHRSIVPDSREVYDYVPLRKGLEVCIRHILENIGNFHLLSVIKIMIEWTFEEELTDECLLDFGNLLEYAAMLHDTYLYKESLHRDLFPLILELIASENRLHSLLGNRVLQYMMDRHNNKIHFDTPKIFFDDIHFNIIVGEYKTEDKNFIRRYREMIHTTLLASIQLHGVHRINLESTYASIAIIVVEVPCGYTAAAVVCLAMAIQEHTLSNDDIDFENAHRLHATVMAIMSLVCWVHKAEVFYDYLRTVVARRAQFAPHLNPPIRASYQYAQHHILWNKPELFFEDWEARYGLWKCFRTRRSRIASLTDVKQGGSQHEID